MAFVPKTARREIEIPLAHEVERPRGGISRVEDLNYEETV